jgi:hypothetical protein
LIRSIKHILFFGFFFLLLEINAAAQTIRDSSGNVVNVAAVNDRRVDSILLHHSPRKAAIRSAILPGWGQAYNKRYWKIPIAYAALGTSAYVFVDNVSWYRKLRFAYKVAVEKDVANYDKVDRRLSRFVETNNTSFLQYQRNEYRRNVDYSVLAFVLLWGLNIVDATVDAHLKSFDVSPDLSLHFKPGYSDMAKTNGISLVLAIK